MTQLELDPFPDACYLVDIAIDSFEEGHDIPLDMEVELMAMGIDVQALRNIYFD